MGFELGEFWIALRMGIAEKLNGVVALVTAFAPYNLIL
jgi:hypothetical protein